MGVSSHQMSGTCETLSTMSIECECFITDAYMTHFALLSICNISSISFDSKQS